MRLPRSVKDIADVLGVERALFLIGKLPRCYAGNTGHRSSRVILYVPTLSRLKPDHELVRILGWPDAVKLVQSFGGEILQPANCAVIYRDYRDQQIVRLAREGMTKPAIADLFGVSVRYVRMLVNVEIPQKESGNATRHNARVNTGRRAHGPTL